VETVEELEAEFNTQYVKDKIDTTTCTGAAERAGKRARKKYTMLMRINTFMRDGLLEAVKDKTLLNHIKNKEYVQTEIEVLNKFPASYVTCIIPLTCIQLIIDIFCDGQTRRFRQGLFPSTLHSARPIECLLYGV